MERKRTKEDNCLICLEKKATKKGSHLMPAGLSASCDQGRNQEELFFIGETINVYYGSNNQRNNNYIHDTTRHKNYNVLDNIFCPDCERKLSVIESAIIPFLTKTVQANKSFITEKETTNKLQYKEYDCVDLAELKLFFYSVIWRLALGQTLNYGVRIFSNKHYGQLRKILAKFLTDDIKDITGNQNILNSIPLTIISSFFPERTMNYYAPHRIMNQPQVFVANEYLVMPHFFNYTVHSPKFGLPLDVFNPILKNRNSGPTKIGFLSDDEWFKLLFTELSFKSKEFQEVRIVELMKRTNKSFKECGAIIHLKTADLQIQQLMEKLNKSYSECKILRDTYGEKLFQQNHIKGYGLTFDDAYLEIIKNL